MKPRNFIYLFLPFIPFLGNAQFQGTISTTESVCQSDGTITIAGANPTSEYLLSGNQIPQIGPFMAVGGIVVFSNLPRGLFTVTEFKTNNSQPTTNVTVPGNYEQNWIFNTRVDYNSCSGGQPTVQITDFTITGATSAQQRPPYTYRISTKGGSLPSDGSIPPPFLAVTSFNIPYPSGMNGNYQIQAKDACGNYKTINVNVPLNVPGPGLALAFANFTNCAGDAIYTATATGGTPNYVFTIVAPSTNQIGATQTTSGPASFTLTAGGSYTIEVMDQCGGITRRAVTVRPYINPTFTIQGTTGNCSPPPVSGTGGLVLRVLGDGIGPYSATITNDCGHPNINLTNLTLNNVLNFVNGLTRPCNYTVTVMDGCGRLQTRTQGLIQPGVGSLASTTATECPSTGSNNINQVIRVGFGPPYSPSGPYNYEIFDSSNNPVMGFPRLAQTATSITQALIPGSYTYQITDACGATTGLIPITVGTYQNPTVSVDFNNPCFGAGQAVVVGVNNNPLSPNRYTYSIISGPNRVGAGPETDSDPNTGKFSSLISGGTYVFRFFDGCRNVNVSITIPNYTQPTWEVGFGALCSGEIVSRLEIVNLEPQGQIVGPYLWRITSEDSDIFNQPLPFPSSAGQSSLIFNNLPPKNSNNDVATYIILGNDGCKNSFQGSGKIGLLPPQNLVLDLTSICADGNAVIRARVSIPIAGATYVFYRDGVEIQRSTNLFSFIMNASPGLYTGRAYPDILGKPECFEESSAVAVTASLSIACNINGQPTCDNANAGSISVTPNSGTPPYTYLWSNGATTASINGLSAGVYTVTVSDGTGCMITCQSTLVPASGCCRINAVIAQDLECLENNTPGIITDNRLRFNITATNSNPLLTTYNVAVNNGTTITPTSGIYGFPIQFTLGAGSGGGGGTFILTLIDTASSNCTQTVTIVDPGLCPQTSNPPCETVNCSTATIQVNRN